MPRSNGSNNSDSFIQKDETKSKEEQVIKLNISCLRLSITEPFPLIMDFEDQLGQFVHQGILKQIEHPGVREKVYNVLTESKVAKLCRVGLEMVLITKYPQVMQTPQLLPLLKMKLSKTYVKLFSLMPQPKDEIVNYIIFICAYNIHWMLWKIAPDQREEMSLRFVFDCYHILIFSVNGIYVSDSYIRLQIEKIFSSKFMEYEREQKEKLILRKLEKKKKNNERTFLGKKIEFPNVSKCDGGNEFSKMLNDKFKMRKGLHFFQKEDDPIKQDNGKFNLHTTINSNENFTNTSKEESTMLQHSKSEGKILLQNLQLNVNQVSPSVFHVLQMNKMQLPFSRKKMLSHTFEKNDNKADSILGLLKEMTIQRQQKKDFKQTKKYQQNLIEVYDLRAPGKEYFQKNPQVDPLFKDMLELNYVLQHQQESFNTLYSTIELQKNLEVKMDDQKTDLSQQSPKQRLTSYLLNKLELQEKIGKQTLITTTDQYMHQQFNKSSKQLLLPPIAEKQNESELSKLPIQKTHDVAKTQGDEVKKNGKKTNNLKLSSRPKFHKEEHDPIYIEKTQAYKKKYDPILNSESTDAKINHIVQNLQVKQNLIGKSLSKKIHKM